MKRYVSMTTLGEIDPEFCDLFKACVREDRPMKWVEVYLLDRFGFNRVVESA